MNRTRSLAVKAVVGALLLMPVGTRVVRAQDPVKVNATSIHVKLENTSVRVLEAVLPPGLKEQMHSHPACIIYVVAGGKLRSHGTDGKVTETEFRTGDVIYREPITHWSENIGTTQMRLIVVELKHPG